MINTTWPICMTSLAIYSTSIRIINDDAKYYDDDDVDQRTIRDETKADTRKTEKKTLQLLNEWRHCVYAMSVELVRCTLIKCDRYYIPIKYICIHGERERASERERGEWMSWTRVRSLFVDAIFLANKLNRTWLCWMETLPWMKIMPLQRCVVNRFLH